MIGKVKKWLGIEGVKLEDYHQAGTQTIESGGGLQIVDPQLVEYESGKVRFAPNSHAGTMEIKPIDVSGAGWNKD
mgnify:CR=1 FL=1